MKNVEFSNEFDVLYQNITSNQAPGLDEYEKSVFLTKAVKMLVRRQFDPVSDQLRQGFDGSQQRQYDFSSLMMVKSLIDVTPNVSNEEKLDSRSSVFTWPEDCFLAVNEIITDQAGNQYSVIPLAYSNYYKLMDKPYQYPTKRTAWRLMTTNNKTFWQGGQFANKDYVLPVPKDFIKKNFKQLSLEFNVEGWSITKLNIEILYTPIENSTGSIIVSAPEVVDVDEAKILVEFRAKENSTLYTYSLGRLLNTIITFPPDGADAVYAINHGTDHVEFVGAQVVPEGVAEGYEITISGFTPLIYMFSTTWRNILFPITLADIVTHGDKSSAIFTVSEKQIGKTLVEIIGRFKNVNQTLGDRYINKYMLRYVKIPAPIILEDLNGLTIDGIGVATECELPVECHQEILEIAVTLAKTTMMGGTQTMAENQQQREE